MSNPVKLENNLDRIQKAEEILNYTFNDKSLLLQAITHPSAVQGNSSKYSYERFEFLGDSLLEAIASVAIFRKYKDLDEGKLTNIRVSMVKGANLSKIMEELGFSDLIIFGKSEHSTGIRGLKNALENVYEAVVAAIFLDGGQIKCWQFVEDTVIDRGIDDINLSFDDNPKSTLQEITQTFHKTPVYNVVKEEGPAHNMTFYVEVSVDNKVLATGVGHSKKEAEADAAIHALEKKYSHVEAL